MATAIVMLKLGNTVESSIIIRWRKQPGAFVSAGEAVCEIETDKATIEVENPMGGTLLAQFFQEGDDVPVMVNIEAVGTPGDDVASLRPNSAAPNASVPATPAASAPTTPVQAVTPSEPNGETKHSGISPRARNLVERRDIDFTIIPGSDHGGRIIERDIQAVLTAQQRRTPLALCRNLAHLNLLLAL